MGRMKRMAVAALLVTGGLGAIAGALAAQIATGAAPAGDASTVASRIIKKNFNSCKKLEGTTRRPDGSILASCSGTRYLVFTVFNPKEGRTIELALNCKAAKQHLDVVC